MNYGKDFKKIINNCRVNCKVNDKDIEFYTNKQNRTFFDDIIKNLLILLKNIISNNTVEYKIQYTKYDNICIIPTHMFTNINTCIDCAYITYELLVSNVHKYFMYVDKYMMYDLTLYERYDIVHEFLNNLLVNKGYNIDGCVYDLICFMIVEVCKDACNCYNDSSLYVINDDSMYKRYYRELSSLINNVSDDKLKKQMICCLKHMNMCDSDMKYKR